MNFHLSRDDDGLHVTWESVKDEQAMALRISEERAARFEATLRAIASAPPDQEFMRKLAHEAVTPQITLPRIFGTR